MRCHLLSLLLIPFLLSVCSCAMSQSTAITDFDSCVAAGNKVLRSYPPKCAAQGVGVFTKDPAADPKLPAPKVSDPLIYKGNCSDHCGDGTCSEIVCEAIGCPCAETPETCPKDCS